jgi:tetratricopeptide (TPR) repeat protein
MRLSIGVALVLGFTSVAISAQDRGMNPLAEQIREQEMATGRAPGNRDGKVWLKLAILRQNAARYRDSEQAYRRAIALLKSGERARLADAMDRMGTMYAECGEFSRAERLERKALNIRELENDVSGMGISHTHLSVLLLGKREFSSAEAEAEAAVRLLIPEQTRPVPPATATPDDQMSALIDLALARCARGDCRSAVPQLRCALSIAHANYSDNSIPVGFADFLLGYALWKSGDNRSAGKLMRNGTQELSTQLGWGHPIYVRAMRQYGMFLTQAGHTSEAEEIRARIAKFERLPGTIDVQSLLFR